MTPIESEVGQVVHRYWNAIDRSDYPTVLELLSEEVDWRVSSNRSGRAEVAQALAQRPADRIVRHLITNLSVNAARGECEAFFLITAFAAKVQSGDTGARHVSGPAVIADVSASFTRIDGALKISRLVTTRVFQGTLP